MSVTVVIRSAGERTIELCRRLVERQVPAADIVVIAEVPFRRALERTFEIGIERDRPWTLALDADVLLRPEAVTAQLALAESADGDTFEVQGRVIDKLFGGPRAGGPHLYRTRLLRQGLAALPPEAPALRPESMVIREMERRGFPFVQTDHVFGLHDFEQFFRDIYRKAFVHAKKHQPAIRYLEHRWRRLSSADPDCEVALWGGRAGSIYLDSPLDSDRERFFDEVDVLLRARGLAEKAELSGDAVAPEEIERIVDGFETPPEFWAAMKRLGGSDGARRSSTRALLQRVLHVTGPVRLIPWIVGRGLERAGGGLVRWSETPGRSSK